MTELPTKLSALLRLAVADAQKWENDGCILEMSEWLSFDDGKPCSACMAGAVMFYTLGICTPPDDQPNFSWVDGDISAAGIFPAMNKIDGLRTGQIQIDDSLINDNVADLYHTMIGDDYSFALGRASWSTYLDAAAMLERAGY